MLTTLVRERVAVRKPRHRPFIIGNHNLHSIYFYKKDPEYRRFFSRADLVLPDGTPLVWLGAFLGRGFRPKNRLTHLDFMPPIFEMLNQRYGSIFFLGGDRESNRKGVRYFSQRYPNLKIAGHHGFFKNSMDSNTAIQKINEFNPDILLVGMGMPIQEKFVFNNLNQLQARVIITAGGFLDYFTGGALTPPRWLSPLGLEWAFRFLQNPTRLFFRYFVEPWFLLPLLLKEVLGFKKLLPPAEVDEAVAATDKQDKVA